MGRAGQQRPARLLFNERNDDLLSPDSVYNISTVVADRTRFTELVRFITTGGSPAANWGILREKSNILKCPFNLTP